MPYERKIAHLVETHAALERELKDLVEQNAPDDLVHLVKKRKLKAKDLIVGLTKLDNAGQEFK